MKRATSTFVGVIAAFAVVLFGFTPAASASTAQEPVVDLSGIQYGVASFQADGSSAAKASLTTKAGVKIYLNVQAKPMTRKQIKPGSCRTAKVGKKFYNEMIDPVTGKHYYKPWRVQAGDNVFCKDRHGVWHKKSCNNKAKGIFGVPRPAKSRIRTHATIRDRLVYKGEIEAASELNGSASAHVVQYDDAGNKVCESQASVSGHAEARFSAWVEVSSRTTAGISSRGSRQAESKLSIDTTVRGVLRGSVKTDMEGSAMAWCNYTPPPPPPPSYDECPNIPGDQPKGYECYPPQEEAPPTYMQFREINDVYVNAITDHCVTVDFPDGHSGQVYWSATYGSFATASKSAQDTVQVCATYKAPSEVPSGGKDTITVTATDSVTGKSVTKTTAPFTIKAMPVTP